MYLVQYEQTCVSEAESDSSKKEGTPCYVGTRELKLPGNVC